MIKEIKYGGMSNVPSDYECADGELAAAVNVVNENGELRSFLHPDPIMTITGTLMFVHKGKGYENFITLAGNALYVQTRTSTRTLIVYNVGMVSKIEALGNTLMVISDKPIVYLLYKDQAYKYLGNKPPELSISFGLRGKLVRGNEFTVDINDLTFSHLYGEFDDKNKNRISDQVLGEANKYIKEQSTDKGLFMFPFFVRYAYRMYDGSLFMHSAPVLMLPSSGLAPAGEIVEYLSSGDVSIGSDGSVLIEGKAKKLKVNILAFQCSLDQAATNIERIHSQLQNWNDIITGVDIFISAPIYTYDQNGQVWGIDDFSGQDKMASYPAFGIMNYNDEKEASYFGDGERVYRKLNIYQTEGAKQDILRMPTANAAKIRETIESNSLFYKIKSLTFDELTTVRTPITLKESILSTLLYQEQMTDDYNSHNTLAATTSYVYNARLNIADIKQKLFSGFSGDALVPYLNGEKTKEGPEPRLWYQYDCYTFIKQDNRDIVVMSAADETLYDYFGYYLYFPNAKAYKMIIHRHQGAFSNEYAEVKLNPHPTLNGAFYFGGFDDLKWTSGRPSVTITDDPTVEDKNKLYNSESNNPFLFPASGIVTIGTGEIKAMASSTKALSQGQFGQFPLYVFTGEGVWALEINEQGSYSSRQMMARDVCNNPKSVTQLDGAIVFTSDQGIIMMQGSEVMSISKALEGPTFSISKLQQFQQVVTAAEISSLTEATTAEVPLKEFLADCIISYDYPNSRLLVINSGKNYAYLYNLRNGLWSMVTSSYINSTNNYPDSYLTGNSGEVSNLSAIISADDPRYVKGLIVSRPLKLDGADVLKTISSLIHKGQFEKSQVMHVLYASRDNITFQPVASSRESSIRRLRGTPYKSFIIVAIPTFLKRNALTKTVVDFELKYTNKLR